MEALSIQALVDELKKLGEAQFSARHSAPAILRRDNTTEADDQGFHTAFMSHNALRQAVASGSGSMRPSAIGQVYFLTKREGGAFSDRVGIGRARNADVHLPLSRVSKYHAFLTASEDGGFAITDAGSKNGTFVDGERLEARATVRLDNGQELGLGPYRFVFYTPSGFVMAVKRRAGLTGG